MLWGSAKAFPDAMDEAGPLLLGGWCARGVGSTSKAWQRLPAGSPGRDAEARH